MPDDNATTVPPSDAGIVSKTVPEPVDETVSKLVGLIEQRGVKVFAVVDHSGEAESHGLQLRDTKLVIFGSPVAGTPVMQAAPLIALDLPLKILVWDDNGVTTISYVSPKELASRYGLPEDLESRLGAVDVITDALIDGS
jgi:uncharacterized protein (DUF302 family)